jgi:hypothetical protein
MFTGIRGRIVSLVPKCIVLATAGGIGLFLAFIGLQNSEGVGLIQYNSATLVTLGKLLLVPNQCAPPSCMGRLNWGSMLQRCEAVQKATSQGGRKPVVQQWQSSQSSEPGAC